MTPTPTSKLLGLVFLVLAVNGAYAQQDPQFSHFHLIESAYNPAAIGLDEALNATALYRTQWVGLNGHPESQVLTADLPLYLIKGAAGLAIVNDVAGAQRTTSLRLNFALQRSIGKSLLSVGLYAGGAQFALDGSKLRAPEGNYPDDNSAINHNDNLIPSTLVSDIVADVGLGLRLDADRWWTGVGATHLLEPKAVLAVSGIGETEITFNRHLHLAGGAHIAINNNWQLSPAVLFKSDLAISQLDVQARVIYRSNIYGGIALRGFNNSSLDALIGMVGMRLSSKFLAGYSYDLNLSALNRVNSGSHELFVKYRLPIEPPGRGKIINNPRFISF